MTNHMNNTIESMIIFSAVENNIYIMVVITIILIGMTHIINFYLRYKNDYTLLDGQFLTRFKKVFRSPHPFQGIVHLFYPFFDNIKYIINSLRSKKI